MANLAKCSTFILVLLCAVPVLAAQAETVSVIRVVDADTIFRGEFKITHEEVMPMLN